MTFRTFDGNLSFYQFGELVSRMFIEAYPGVSFQQAGEPDDDAAYPSITWKNAGRILADDTPLKSKLIETVYDAETNEPYTRYMRVTRNVFQVEIKAKYPREADQLTELFESFMDEMTAALLRLGVKRLYYAGRKADTITTAGALPLSVRTIEWVMHEQKSTTIKESSIEKVEMLLRTITEEGEEEAPITSTF